MNTLQTIENKISAAKDLDFGDIFNKSIELFKKSWLQGFLLQLFILLIMLPVIIVFYIPFVMAMIAQSEQSGYYGGSPYDDVLAGFSILSILLFFVAIIVLSAVAMCMQAGFYRILKHIDDGKAPVTRDFFVYLKGDMLTKGLLLSIASVIISMLAALLCYLPLLYVMVPIYFFAPFFGFNEQLSVSDIVKASFKLGTKKWLIAFGLIIVASLLSTLVGYLACGIGILFTSAFIYHPVYFIYKEIIGFEPTDEINEIGLIEE